MPNVGKYSSPMDPIGNGMQPRHGKLPRKLRQEEPRFHQKKIEGKKHPRWLRRVLLMKLMFVSNHLVLMFMNVFGRICSLFIFIEL